MSTALAVIEPETAPSGVLAKLDQARTMLAESRTLSDVKKIRDIAEAARVYAKAAHLGQEAQNYAAEIALLASRRAGAILQQLEKSDGGRPKTGDNVSGVSEYQQTLNDTSTNERTAQRWQELADVPEETLQEYLDESKELGTDITRAGLTKRAKKAVNAKNPKPVMAPDQPAMSAGDITARLTALSSELTSLNAFTKQLKYDELDEPSKTEVGTLIACLRKISKDAGERANRLQAAIQ